MKLKTPPTTETSSEPEHWVDRFGDYLYAFAIARVNDPSIAEDLVQETFLAGLKSWQDFQGRSSVRTWLTGILKHKLMDYLRRSYRTPTVEEGRTSARSTNDYFDPKGHLRMAPAKWVQDPSEVLHQKEFFKILFECIAELPPRQRRAFVLREFDGLETEEICKVLNITATNSWAMLSRARLFLRRCLEKKWFTAPSNGTKK